MNRRFNPRGFRAYLEARNVATAAVMVRHVRHAFKHRVRYPDDVDVAFADLSPSTRRYYRHALRRYIEFQEVA